ncbi:hypothetical protein CGH37_23475 [Vibrio parahaemolyticus]|nr:hypothetical protein CGI78_23470 [Vibrio parahaemolyticus]TOO33724.1 hypothetical protein CGH37_23475 [Vibrio parahaemolyticus]TOO39658.1 hypothetical protein CGH36_23520 [Vibrio parahaemolyticus]
MFREEQMKISKLLIASSVLFLSACNSTGSSLGNSSTVLENAKAYTYESVKVPSLKEATPSDYVYYAAKQADKMKFKKFALIQEYSKDQNGNFRASKITAFMFNGDEDFSEIKRYEKVYRKLQILGVFETEEYKDKRFIPVGYIPGAA